MFPSIPWKKPGWFGWRGPDTNAKAKEGLPARPQGSHGQMGYWRRYIIIQWIGLRENLQETIDFPIKYGGFL